MKRILLVALFCAVLNIVGMGSAEAQRLAARTNLVGIATLSPNISVDLAVSRRVSLEFGMSYNSWGGLDGLQEEPKMDWMQKRHVTFDSNARYWFARPFNGHAAILSAKVGTYNYDLFGLKLYGDVASLGGGYAYSYVLSRRWNIEGSLIGGVALKSTISEVGGKPQTSVGFMIHRIGVSIVYVIK